MDDAMSRAQRLDFARQLMTDRDGMKVTIARWAKASGVPARTITRMEKEGAIPRIATLTKLRRSLDAIAAELLEKAAAVTTALESAPATGNTEWPAHVRDFVDMVAPMYASLTTAEARLAATRDVVLLLGAALQRERQHR